MRGTEDVGEIEKVLRGNRVSMNQYFADKCINACILNKLLLDTLSDSHGHNFNRNLKLFNMNHIITNLKVSFNQ